MIVYGDDCEITPGMIRGEFYSFVLESKTALFVQKPADRATRGFQGFFIGFPLCVAAGAFAEGGHYVVVFPSLFVSAFAALSLLKSLRPSSDGQM